MKGVRRQTRAASCWAGGSLGRVFGAALLAVASGTACKPGKRPTPGAPTAVAPSARACRTEGSARVRGAHCLARARAAKLGFAFDPRRGTEALAWLAEAASCYHDGSDAEAAMAAQRQLQAWQAKLNGTLRTSHLRLTYALRRQHTAVARQELARLRGLIGGHDQTGYRAWLDDTERRLH